MAVLLLRIANEQKQCHSRRQWNALSWLSLEATDPRLELENGLGKVAQTLTGLAICVALCSMRVARGIKCTLQIICCLWVGLMPQWQNGPEFVVNAPIVVSTSHDSFVPYSHFRPSSGCSSGQSEEDGVRTS